MVLVFVCFRQSPKPLLSGVFACHCCLACHLLRSWLRVVRSGRVPPPYAGWIPDSLLPLLCYGHEPRAPRFSSAEPAASSCAARSLAFSLASLALRAGAFLGFPSPAVPSPTRRPPVVPGVGRAPPPSFAPPAAVCGAEASGGCGGSWRGHTHVVCGAEASGGCGGSFNGDGVPVDLHIVTPQLVWRRLVHYPDGSSVRHTWVSL